MYRSHVLVTSDLEPAGAPARGPARGPARVWATRFSGRAVTIMAAWLLLAACAQSGKSATAPNTPPPGTPTPGTPAPATVWRSADKLLGLVPEALLAALGAPARIRAEENARIYQYVGRDCVLDFFLYPAAEGLYRVSYAEARSILAEKQPVDACLRSLPAPIVAANAQPSS